MDRHTWKQAERDWAEFLGGVRVPITGRARGDEPDIRHDRFSIEVKAGKVLSNRTRQGMKQAVASRAPGQVPIVCITHSVGLGRPNERYVLVRAEDWKELVRP